MRQKKKSSILLPIRKKYVEALFSGTKNFELRRRIPKNKVKVIYVYETKPTSRIVGKLHVKKILDLKIADLWKKTKGQNSLTRKELETYFKDRKRGFAFEISEREKFADSFGIEEYNLKYPPQGFVYVWRDK